jgi:hypothetical protein
VAVNPETDEEGFYLAQLREDVFSKVQSVVHVLWLEPTDEEAKSVWQFEEYDTIPCGSIICRVTLKVFMAPQPPPDISRIFEQTFSKN